MTKPSLALRPRWQAVFRPSSFGRMDELRAFRLDYDGDGIEELCLQIGESFFALGPKGLVADKPETFVARLPPGPEGELRWAEANERGDLCLMVDGALAWRRSLGRRRLSLGGHRDYEDEWSWSPWKGLGPYLQEHRIVALTGAAHRGEPAVVALLADARMLAFDLTGEPVWTLRLSSASLDRSASILLPEANQKKAGDEMLVQGRFREIHLLLGMRRWVNKQFVCLLDGGKILDRQLDCIVSHRTSRSPGELVEDRPLSDRLLVWADRRLRFRPKEVNRARGFSMARDLFDHWRAVQLSEGSVRGSLRAALPDGETLWELPPSAIGEEIRGCEARYTQIGGSEIYVLLLSVSRQLQSYDTQVPVTRLLVVRGDGVVLADEETGLGQPLGRLDSGDALAAPIDLDGRGVPSIFTMGGGVLALWNLPSEARVAREPLAEAESWSKVPFPLPPEDLWSRDLLRFARGSASPAAGESRE